MSDWKEAVAGHPVAKMSRLRHLGAPTPLSPLLRWRGAFTDPTAMAAQDSVRGAWNIRLAPRFPPKPLFVRVSESSNKRSHPRLALYPSESGRIVKTLPVGFPQIGRKLLDLAPVPHIKRGKPGAKGLLPRTSAETLSRASSRRESAEAWLASLAGLAKQEKRVMESLGAESLSKSSIDRGGAPWGVMVRLDAAHTHNRFYSGSRTLRHTSPCAQLVTSRHPAGQRVLSGDKPARRGKGGVWNCSVALRCL